MKIDEGVDHRRPHAFPVTEGYLGIVDVHLRKFTVGDSSFKPSLICHFTDKYLA